jgi:uncharacterized protein (TIRG00374 family)
MKKFAKVLVSLLVSAVALFVAFRGVEFSKVWLTLKSVSVWPIVPLLFFLGLHLVVRSLRWRYLLPESQEEPPTIRTLFDSLMLGAFASFILPLRAGEFVRPLVLTKWSRYSFSTAFVSVVIERFFDLSAVLLTFAIILPFLPQVPEEAVKGAYALGAMALALVGFLACSSLFPKFIRSTVAHMASFLPEQLERLVVAFVRDLIDGAAVVKTPKRLFVVVVLTAIVWATAYLQFFAMLLMFPGEPTLLLSVVVGVFVALAIAIPSAPGFIGVFQIGCVAACALFHYPLEVSQAFSLVAHAVAYLSTILIGAALLVVHGLSLGQLRRS